jgi:hypothetical protein
VLLCAQQDLQQPGLPRHSSVPEGLNTGRAAGGNAAAAQAPALLRQRAGGSTGQAVPAGGQLPPGGGWGGWLWVGAGLFGGPACIPSLSSRHVWLVVFKGLAKRDTPHRSSTLSMPACGLRRTWADTSDLATVVRYIVGS